MSRLLVLIAVLLGGCSYKVHVTSRPTGAVMTWNDGESLVLPTTVAFPWRPFRPPRIEVTAPGYRPLELQVTRRIIGEADYAIDPVRNPREAFGGEPRRTLEIVLIPEHGPAGTWDRRDVPGEVPPDQPEGGDGS